MAKKLRAPGKVRLDVLHAVKRGAMHRGFLVTAKPPVPQTASKPAEESKEPMPSEDGSINTSSKPGLKKSDEPKSAKGPDCGAGGQQVHLNL